MSRRRTGVSVALVALTSSLLVAAATPSAWAQTTTVCVPQAASKPILSTSAKGECPTKGKVAYKPASLPEPAELETLGKLLAHVSYVEKGIAGKPTVQFSGVDVQVVNGEGKTATANGEGNLVIGYDEEPGAQTGSHNLILGERQEFTSEASLLGGEDNKALGFATAVFGTENAAEGSYNSVLGGAGNVAHGYENSITGGLRNQANGVDNAVSGGIENDAEGNEARFGESISGGEKNRTSCQGSSVSGGIENLALGNDAWAGGGQGNTSGSCPYGHGGIPLIDTTAVSGGYHNDAHAEFSSIFGGKEQETTKEFQAKL